MEKSPPSCVCLKGSALQDIRSAQIVAGISYGKESAVLYLIYCRLKTRIRLGGLIVGVDSIYERISILLFLNLLCEHVMLNPQTNRLFIYFELFIQTSLFHY